MRKCRLLFVFAFIMLLPMASILTACEWGSFVNGGSSENSGGGEQVEDYYNITLQQTTGGRIATVRTKARAGEMVELSYTENQGYSFIMYIVKDKDNNNIEVLNSVFTMPESNVTITATFNKILEEKHAIEIIEVSGVEIGFNTSGSNDGFLVNVGVGVTLTYAIDNPNRYKFVSWVVKDANDNDILVTNNAFSMPASDVTITAIIEEIRYTITIDESIQEKCGISVIVNGSKEFTTVYYQASIHVVCTPKAGYTFTNWNISNGRDSINSRNAQCDFYANGNVLISAEFSYVNYTVKLQRNYSAGSLIVVDSEGRNIIQSNDIGSSHIGQVLQVKFVPKANYKFKELYIMPYTVLQGWYHYDDVLVEYDEDYKFIMPAKNVEIALSLELVEDNYYTITYDLEDDVVNAVNNPNGLYSGDGDVELYAPTRDGYNFNYWVDQKGNYYYDSITASEVGENLTLSAVWDPIQYSISFNANGGNGNEMQTIYEVAYDEFVSLPQCTFEKDFYDFTGWATSQNGEVVYEDLARVKNLTNENGVEVVLYAIWAPTIYYLTYIDNDGVNTISYDITSEITVKNSKKTGYTLDYYEVTVPGGNWDANTRFLIWSVLSNNYGDATLTAHYTINQYTITFVLNNGEDNIVIREDYGTEIVAPQNPERQWSTFIGWDKDIPTTMPAENITITACYDSISYEIYYYDKDYATFSGIHSDNFPTTYVYNELVTLDTPTKTGYIFSGYYLDSECEVDLVTTLQTQIFETATAYLYAKWTPITYQIKFNSYAYSEVHYQTLTYDEPELLWKNEFTLELYDFAGWSIYTNNTIDWFTAECDFEDEEVVMNLAEVQGAEITLNSIWHKKTFTLTFVDEDWNEIDSYDYQQPSYPNGIDITAYNKEGYTFNYWQIVDGEFHGQFYDHAQSQWIYYHYIADTDNDVVALMRYYSAYGTATLMAYNTVNEYTITFECDDEIIGTITQNYGTEITGVPNAPTKTGYDFAGWDTEIPATMPAENLIIKATYSEQTYNITYKQVGGADLTNVTFEDYPTTHKYSETTQLVYPVKEGCFAQGFYINIDGSGNFIDEISANSITSDITLYVDFIEATVNYEVLNMYPKNMARITGLNAIGQTRNKIVIPAQINGLEVREIAGQAFSDYTNLEMVVIPSTVKNIQSNAFVNCLHLWEVVNLSECDMIAGYGNCLNTIFVTDDINYVSRIKTIGNMRYYEYEDELIAVELVNNVANVVFDANCTKIHNYVFYNNTSIQTINFGTKITNIGRFAFAGCTGLISITIPEAITHIDLGAFSSCTNLTDVYFNAIECAFERVLGNYVFGGCTNLTNIVIGSSVTAIPAVFMATNSSLTSITIPKSVKTIGGSAFMSCTNLKTVVFENQSELETIEASTFESCVNLESMTIPKSVKSINNSAFNSCRKLQLTLEQGSVLETIGIYVFYYCQAITEWNTPSTITSIGENSFGTCINLKDVYINNAYVYNNATGVSAVGGLIKAATKVYVLASVYENVNNSNSYLTDATIYTQPTGVRTIGGVDYYIFTKI